MRSALRFFDHRRVESSRVRAAGESVPFFFRHMTLKPMFLKGPILLAFTGYKMMHDTERWFQCFWVCVYIHYQCF